MAIYSIIRIANFPISFITKYINHIHLLCNGIRDDTWWSKSSKKVIWLISTGTFSLLCLTGIVVWQFVKPYQMERLLAFLDPKKYADGAGFTILKHSGTSIKSGLVWKQFMGIYS